MIVGIVALITALFLGGPGEFFYVDNLDKGIKKNVLDKECKKEILTEYKITKNIIKDYEKERKNDFKKFKELYLNKTTSKEKLESFFTNLQTNRSNHQANIIDQRILIFEKIESQEWDNIIATSETAFEKRKQKLEKKALKSKGVFIKTKAEIENSISNENQKNTILKAIDQVENNSIKLEESILTINVKEDKILANKNANKNELLEIARSDSKIRIPFVTSIINFHQILKENSSDEEFNGIMKVFFKEAKMSSK